MSANRDFQGKVNLVQREWVPGGACLSDEFAAKYVLKKSSSVLWADWDDRLEAARKLRAKTLAGKADPKKPNRPKPWEVDPDPREWHRKRAIKDARNAIEKAKRSSLSDHHPIIPGVTREKVVQAFAGRRGALGIPDEVPSTEVPSTEEVSPTQAPVVEIASVPAESETATESRNRRKPLRAAALIGLGLVMGAAIGVVGSSYLSRDAGLRWAALSPPPVASGILADQLVASGLGFVAPAAPSQIETVVPNPAFSDPAARQAQPFAGLPADIGKNSDGAMSGSQAQSGPRPVLQNSIAVINALSPPAPSPPLRVLPVSETLVSHLTKPAAVQSPRPSGDIPSVAAASLTVRPSPLLSVAALPALADGSGMILNLAAEIPIAQRPASPTTLGQPGDALPFSCDACTSTAPGAATTAITIHVTQGQQQPALAAMLDALQSAGFGAVTPTTEDLGVQSNQVRYYYPQDARAAQVVAELTRSELLDLSWFRPLPEEGVIEVWLADTEAAPNSPE